jgi:hypothetical protein
MPLADFGYHSGDYLGSICGILATGSRHNIAMPAAIAARLPAATSIWRDGSAIPL